MSAATGGVAAPVPASGATPPAGPRDPDLVLARVHLLLGSLSLARTELETLAGRGALDDEAIRDLAGGPATSSAPERRRRPGSRRIPTTCSVL